MQEAGTKDSITTPISVMSLSAVTNAPTESRSDAAPSENDIKESTGMQSTPLCDVVDGVFGETAFAENESFPLYLSGGNNLGYYSRSETARRDQGNDKSGHHTKNFS
jgi:hypothetical protein